MRILMLSNIGGYLDEGQKKVATHLAGELSKRHVVWHLNASQNVFSLGFWTALARFRPDVVHIFLRPNTSTLLLARVLKIASHGTRVVVSALQPPLNVSAWKLVAPSLKPDLILTLSETTDCLFQRVGCRTSFLGCGVDTEKFSPVGTDTKFFLRRQYGIDVGRSVILHVGSLTRGRNLLLLTDMQERNDYQVVVVYSPAFKPDPVVYQRLKESGCILWGNYLESVEEVYQLADCYFFPTLNPSNCIELPLSVLEAMSCNLPVITSRFGALVTLFHQGDGFFYFDSLSDAYIALELIKNKDIPVKMRERVIGYTWDSIACDLESIYARLLAEA